MNIYNIYANKYIMTLTCKNLIQFHNQGCIVFCAWKEFTIITSCPVYSCSLETSLTALYDSAFIDKNKLLYHSHDYRELPDVSNCTQRCQNRVIRHEFFMK